MFHLLRCCRALLALFLVASGVCAADSSRAPDDQIAVVNRLLQQDKYLEALKRVEALLALYEGDARLDALKTQIVALAAAAKAVPGAGPAPAAPEATDFPGLTGMDLVQASAVETLVKEAEAAPASSAARREKFAKVIERTEPLVKKFPTVVRLWQFRAAAALETDNFAVGGVAGERLLALSGAKPAEPTLKMLGAMELKEWLGDKARERTARVERDAQFWQREGRARRVERLGLDLVPVAPGTFRMGQGNGFIVTLTRGFWLGKTEVTQAQWSAVMGNNPSYFKGDDRPVEQVSYEDALAFGRKLTERERAAGSLPEGFSYTLPTEAQWEYACRAGTTGDYAGDLNAMAWYEQNSGSTTHAVATKQPNAWGLYDLHGNVWEWCLDWHWDYPGGSVSDPKGASSGTIRVLRGGGWVSTAVSCRSARRDGDSPGIRSRVLGFRLALSFSP